MRGAWLLLPVLATLSVTAHSQSRTLAPETLKAVSALPAHVLAGMQDPASVARTRDGDFLVLDRRAHTVWRADPRGVSVRRLMEIGHEPGRLLRPSMLSMGPDDIFAVMDAPNGLQRIQYFSTTGMLIGGFFLPIVGSPSLVMGDTVVAGVGAMAFAGRTFLVNEPAWGSLVAELDTTGSVVRHIGQLRPTGQERDTELHLALNTGIPVVDPTGGFFFVFQTGVPMFRKYDASGTLVFERHIEGRELDGLVQGLPNRWLTRPAGVRPFPAPMIRTAAADAAGQLWVALRTSQVYVYDTNGEKTRVVQLAGARPLLPASFFFPSPERLVVGPDGYEFDTH